LLRKIRTEILKVKGTRHYKANQAFSVGELSPDSNILLIPEPQNPHDKNAVAVLSSKQKMLGHISKEIAAKYQLLCMQNKIINVKVHSADTSNDYTLLDIRISVTYSLEGQSFKNKPNISTLPSSPGTYEISLECGPTYIGATGNLRRRYAQHLNELRNKNHSNKVLQADFDISRLSSFKFTVLRNTSTKVEAEKFESLEISSRLKSGKALYNKTLDGKGTNYTNNQSSNTISDIFNKNQILSSQSLTTKNETPISPFTKKKSGRVVPQNNPSTIIKQPSITQVHANGGTYEGSFIDGKLTGLGKYTSAIGDTYEGDLVDGAFTGEGKYTFANGDTYEGRFHKGRRVGKGTFTRHN